MNSTEFKVGDRVKVVDGYSTDGRYKNDDVGELIKLDFFNDLWIVNINGNDVLINELEIELIEGLT